MNLPNSIKDRANLALKEILPPTQERLLRYLANNPDTFTHTLASECSVGYPPARFHELNSLVLPKYGLRAVCHKPAKWLTNRHGEQSRVHQWRLIKLSSLKEAS